MLKARLQARFLKGSIHRGLLIRARVNFERISGIRIKFDKNTVVLVTKAVVPVSNRVYGPVLRELCMRWPSLGCVSNCII
jgi:ribosomal protein L14